MTDNTTKERESWHLDKRVPLALIVALLIQTGGMVWWAATIQAEGNAREARLVKLEQQTANDRAVGERLARVEERLAAQGQDISNIERYLRQLVYDRSGSGEQR